MDPETRGPRDYGRDPERDFGDEPPPAIRDAPPDYLGRIDEGAAVSGHVPAREATGSILDAPEHDWGQASALVYPALRPPGTQGVRAADIDREALVAQGGKARSQPIVDEGPAGLVVVYGLQAGGFDVIVNADHLVSWGIRADELRTTALANLAAWSDGAPWTDEVSGDRRLVSSDSGEGWDAARILLPEVRERLAE
ncbi:MAG TPA: hypothetical protein VGC90_08635, partial [Candidatus Limnocylindrales bacterium]